MWINIPGYPQPCPCCGRCPLCGGYKAEPVNPNPIVPYWHHAPNYAPYVGDVVPVTTTGGTGFAPNGHTFEIK